MGKARMIEAWGETKRRAEWVLDSRCVVGLDTLRRRLDSGWLPEDAMTMPAREYRTLLTAWGETKSVSEWAKDARCVVEYKTLIDRVKAGMAGEDAVARRLRRNWRDIKPGERFGSLYFVNICNTNNRKHRKGRFICDCGNVVDTRLDGVLSGHCTSCGCYRKERAANAIAVSTTKPRLSKTRLYHVYYGMLDRCHNKHSKNYKNYGDRGIYVCEAWRNSGESFYDWAMRSGWLPGLTIDRIDNDGPYSPANCRFVDAQSQANNRRSTRWITAFGERKSMAEWSRDSRCTVSYAVLSTRIRTGWAAKTAITTPLLQQRSRSNDVA